MKRPDRVTWAAIVTLLLQAMVGSIPAEEQDKAPAEARHLKITLNANDGAEMVLIPGGRFWMGSAREEVDAQFLDTGLPEDWKKYTRDEEPRHERTLEPFYIYQYEVTNAQYKAFLDATGHRSPPHWKTNDYPADKGQHPVVEVSWDDAQAYCRWAAAQLPTEAQWEFAARGPEPALDQSSRCFPWGDAWDRQLCNNASLHADMEIQSAEAWKEWYEGDQKSRFPLTSPVGAFPKSVSPFGLHDLAGNAWEWCADIPSKYPDQRPEDAEDMTLRARRGGSWANVALHIRSTDRQPAAHDDLNIYTGFRCVKIP